MYARGAQHPDHNVETFSFAVDVWAIGVITFRIVSGRLPFPDPRHLFDYVVYDSALPVYEPMSTSCKAFIANTMAASPHARPTSQAALLHSWIVSGRTAKPNQPAK
jgi:serine/threonine protein kinase